MNDAGAEGAKTIRLAERRIFSPSFKPLYNEGMGLVEQAAEYLDGQGRVEAKRLSRIAATLYAAESMRLTTRLMQIASWLLLQRAANSGEMTRELPDAFVALVHRSLKLQSLIRRMDEEIYGGTAAVIAQPPRMSNPVSDQIMLLNTAFARG